LKVFKELDFWNYFF